MTVMMQAAPQAAPRIEAMAVNSVRMTAEFEARLVAVASRLGMSKSDVIRQALGDFLTREEVVARAQAQAELMREFDYGPAMGVAQAV
jgi:predicted transcriptional regulator